MSESVREVASSGEFTFEGYDWDAAATSARFRYTLRTEDGPLGAAVHRFTEVIDFTAPEGPPPAAPESGSALDRSLVFAGSLLGISYFKAALPPVYTVVPEGLGGAARDLLREAITQGLGELSFRNGLQGLPRPELRLPPRAEAARIQELSASRRRRPLVAVGGGKDSAVSVRLLQEAGFPLIQVAVNPNAVIRRVMSVVDAPAIGITRRIDPLLFELNAAGAVNGHVPVTAMNSALMVAQSVLLDAGPVVMSNERSSSEPTLVWNGEAVNHQWSKSLEAEQMLAAAFTEQTGVPGLWFSFLRPFSELRIAGLFAESEAFDAEFVSCNRAFRLTGAREDWCGDCDKCRFVALALGPFMSAERHRGIFKKDMFDDASQLPGYEDLLGLTDQKPWECVGEIDESRIAAGLIAGSAAWGDSLFARWVREREPAVIREAEAGAAGVLAPIYPSPAQVIPAEYEEVRRAAA